MLGGLLAWGLIGVFLGPVILAVAFEVLKQWSRAEHLGLEDEPEADRDGGGERDVAGRDT